MMGPCFFWKKASTRSVRWAGSAAGIDGTVPLATVDDAIEKPDMCAAVHANPEQTDASGEVEAAAIDVPVVSAHRWETGSDVIYSKGWAIGRLVLWKAAKSRRRFR